MSNATAEPETVRELDTPAARELGRLAELLDELHTVLRCCERLIDALAEAEPDDLLVDALWTTAVLGYARCFRDGSGLDEDDVTATELEGEVLEWHRMLARLREHCVDRERSATQPCSIGVTQEESGRVAGIAITSAPPPKLDTTTVQQTGALAYALAQRVDEQMTEQQQRVRATLDDLDASALERLPRIELAPTS